MREALTRRCDIVDLGVRLPHTLRTGLKIAHLRPGRAGLTSSWDYSAVTDAVVRRLLVRSTVRTEPDAAIQIQDLARLPVPYYTYQDMSFGALRRLIEAGEPLTHFPALSQPNLERRDIRQRAIYAEAAGVITMSRWLAGQLVQDGVDPSKIHVVHPGINSPIHSTTIIGSDPERGPFRARSAPRSLLFLGRDFHTKGGDLVVAALPLVRRRFRSDTRLVIAGPPRWPLKEPPPEGVTFLGQVPQIAVDGLLDDCDLFVMPSRFEGFGIALAEALVAGRPCVARRHYAMPEIVHHGQNGRLLERADASMLADAICDALTDEGLFARTWEQRAQAAAYWSWDRAAADVLVAME